MMRKHIKLPPTVDGFHFHTPLALTRVLDIDTAMIGCLWPDCRCEHVQHVMEFIQHGWWDDEHLLIVYCERCRKASGYYYKVSEPSVVAPEMGVINESEGSSDAD